MELLGALAVLFIVGFIGLVIIGSALALIGLVVKALFWLILLPFRLILGLILLPLLLLKFVVGGILLLAVGPIVVIAAVVGFIALVAALLAPLLPLAILVGLVWLVVRAARPAVA